MKVQRIYIPQPTPNTHVHVGDTILVPTQAHLLSYAKQYYIYNTAGSNIERTFHTIFYSASTAITCILLDSLSWGELRNTVFRLRGRSCQRRLSLCTGRGFPSSTTIGLGLDLRRLVPWQLSMLVVAIGGHVWTSTEGRLRHTGPVQRRRQKRGREGEREVAGRQRKDERERERVGR